MRDRRHGDMSIPSMTRGKRKRLRQRKRVCSISNKICYTKAEARLKTLSKETDVNSFYRCSNCGTFHTSHYKEGEFVR